MKTPHPPTRETTPEGQWNALGTEGGGDSLSEVPTGCPSSLVSTLPDTFLPNSSVRAPLPISFRGTHTTGPQRAPRQEVTMSEIGREKKGGQR